MKQLIGKEKFEAALHEGSPETHPSPTGQEQVRTVCHAPMRAFSADSGRDTRQRCFQCKSRKTFYICKECKKPLCIDDGSCWEAFNHNA